VDASRTAKASLGQMIEEMRAAQDERVGRACALASTEKRAYSC
jgi:hypothetical protein